MDLFELRVELHSHTDFDPRDWIEHSAEELIDKAARQGVQVLAITCHRALQWSAALKDYAEASGVLLIPAVEASIEGKDVLIYGLEHFQHPMSFEQLRQLRAENPVVFAIAPHPFYPGPCLGQLLFQYEDCFDAIEYCHFYTRQVNFNEKAVEAARRLNKPLVGTSDIHFLSQVGKTTSIIKVRERSLRAVSKAVKAGHVTLETRPLTTPELVSQVLEMGWMTAKSHLWRWGLIPRNRSHLQKV